MEQQNSTVYSPSSYPSMMEMPVPLPLRAASDSRQQSFEESSYFNTVPQEILNFPVTTVAESSLDPWFMDMPGQVSPRSSRLSLSPPRDVATPSSDGYYSPPYPEQLQLPAYHFLEQPQSMRTCSTSHSNWVSNGENWEHNYIESELLAAQPYIAQPWVPGLYNGFAPQHIAEGHVPTNGGALAHYTSNYPQSQAVQAMTSTVHGNTSTVEAKDEVGEEEEDSSDEDSDWDEESSDYSQGEHSVQEPKRRTPSARPHVDRWSIQVNSIQQSDVRAHKCTIPGCPTAFVRPEHLRRHIRSKHTAVRAYKCKVEGCKTLNFSRGDNLRDHYWTHLDRGGRVGKNKKFPFQELKEILGSKEKKLVKRLREKQRQYEAKERLKRQRVARPAYAARSKL